MDKLSDVVKKLTGKGPNKSVGVGKSRSASGFGYVCIPENSDRDAYIRSVRETGLVMLATSQNQIIKNCSVPKHILQELEFPQKSAELGSQVHWINVPKTNQLVVTGIHIQPGEFAGDSNLELTTVYKKVMSGNIISTTQSFRENFLYALDMINTISEVGQVRFKAYSSASKESLRSELTLNVSGRAKLHGSVDTTISSDKSISLLVGYKKDEKTAITITTESLIFADQFENKVNIAEKIIELICKDGKIKLGTSPEQAALKGNTTQTELKKNKTRLDTLLQAIQSAPIVPQDGGASFKAALVAAIQTMISENYDDILSQEVFLT